MNYDKIPQELKDCKNWVGWKAVPDENDPRHFGKVPVCITSGEKASSTDPRDWEDFDTAVNSMFRSQLGFVFTDTLFFGVDIDKQDDALAAFLDGDTDNIIGEFITALGSYAELSPSGRGVHIICKGSLPGGANRKGCVEMYETGRFFTMTGNCISDLPIADCTETIKPLFEKYLKSPAELENYSTFDTEKLNNTQVVQVSLSVSERLEKARASKSGAKFSALMSGIYDGLYGSHSEADMALCNMLAFWLDRNTEDIDRVFRSSGLMRDKWDRKQSGSTYGALTIQKAVGECKMIFGDFLDRKSNYSLSISGGNGETVKQPELNEYTFDDTGNASRLADLYGERLKFCYEKKNWFFWNGKNWEEDVTGTIDRIADDSLSVMDDECILYAGDPDMLKKFRKHIHNSRSSRAKTAMKTELRHRLPIKFGDLDNNVNLFNTPAGVIDLRNCKLYPHKRELYLSRIAGSEISSADCPVWENFLNTILGGNEDIIRYIQKALGYSLLGSNSEQCMFFLYGRGSNGKSTMLEPIRRIFGDYAANAQAETLMETAGRAGAARSDLARLKGVRLLTVSEPDEGSRLNESLIKQVTGGDPLTARFQYGTDFEFTPYFTMWVPTNYRPIIRGTDDGIWRRIRVIPFNVQIPDDQKDTSLPSKLMKELPMIFGWILEGLKLYRDEGLTPPKEVREMTETYRREMDVVSGFVAECCVLDPNASETASDLYDAYCHWAETGSERIVSRRTFSQELLKRNGVQRIRNNGAVYRGIKLM